MEQVNLGCNQDIPWGKPFGRETFLYARKIETFNSGGACS